MLSKKSFTLLVENGTIPFFAFVSIISLKDCSIRELINSCLHILHADETMIQIFLQHSINTVLKEKKSQ